MANVVLSKFGEKLWEQIKEWDIQVDKTVEDCINEVAKDTKKVIKENTPKRRRKGKNFVNCYKVTPKNKRYKYVRIVHNEKYQLAHLLEDGHKVYTRLGKKTDPLAVKTGPYDIHTIWATDKNHIEQKPKLTSRYDMWYKGRKYAEEKAINLLEKRLKELGKL